MGSEKPLEIATGCPVFVEVSDTAEKLKSHIVGYDQKNYVIIACPRANNCVDKAWQPGTSVVIKYVHEGVVIAFQTPVLNAIQAPANLIFLAYPREITRQNLRGWKRYQCEFKAWLQLGEQEIGGQLIDISVGGCCCSIPSSTLEGIDISGDGIKSEVTVQQPDSNELIKLSATISNSWNSGDNRNFGVAFQSLDSKQERQVKDLIFAALRL